MAVSLRRPLMSRNGERVAPFTTPEQQPLDIFSFVLIDPIPPLPTFPLRNTRADVIDVMVEQQGGATA